jgi:putative ABC transport system substrate-binding protein
LILNRRGFITLGCCTLWIPAPAKAQSSAPTSVYRVGYVTSIGTTYKYPVSDPRSGSIRPFAEGMRGLGYVENQNLQLVRRSAEGVPGRGGEIATELIGNGIDVIVVTTGEIAKEMMGVTSTVPIVMAASVDPVALGVAASLSRPGGNITGFDIQVLPEFDAKRLQFLKDVIPNVTRVAFLGTKADWESTNGSAVHAAAASLGITLFHAEHTLKNYADAFAMIARESPNALFVSVQPSPVPNSIIDFASQQQLPAIYPWRQYVVDGGLMSYGVDLADQYRRAAGYVDRILKGEKPGELPIQQPIKFELVINLKTAKALGLEMPAPVLAQAADVFE